jgi:hypothetical protein
VVTFSPLMIASWCFWWKWTVRGIVSAMHPACRTSRGE